MPLKRTHIKIDKLDGRIGTIRGLEISIGKIIDGTEAEEVGPTPFPSTTDLRRWDFKLLNKYKPFYMPFCDLCCLCTFGKCDLSTGKRGACGLDIAAQQSRIVLIACCIGAATHLAHARHLYEHVQEQFGSGLKIDTGGLNLEVEAPVVRLVCGVKPKTLGDLDEVLNYCETEVTHLLSATHTGQEGNNLDFESKAFHAGMIDQVALEVAELAQISAYNFPKADPESSLVQTGLGVIDKDKPVIMVVGHNVLPSIGIIDYLHDNGLEDIVEVTGLCCTAHDITRYSPKAKIVGPISWQLRYVRSGLPDVVVVDEQCIRADILNEAQKIKAPLIATSPKNCLGLPDRTDDQVDIIVDDLVNRKASGVLILNPEKVGEVASKIAIAIAPKRKKRGILPSRKKMLEEIKKCEGCYECERACPNNLPILSAISESRTGSLRAFEDLYEGCIGCARCESACPQELALHSFILKASQKRMRKETFVTQTGRGAIQDVEIRNVGGPIVLGEIPGVVAYVGCANYPNGGREVAEMIMEFARRRFIVLTSGCAAMSASMYRTEDGKNLYESFPHTFDAGGLINVGSCVSNSHIAGAAIKIANIFAKRNLLGNYEEIADYIHNRVGAVGVAWGAMSQKAAAIASGFWRLGIPVIVGPHGAKYRRMLLGREDLKNEWMLYDARTGNKVYGGPTPEHLFYSAETKEEAIVMTAKLAMRPNDTSRGRAIKLTHYIDLSRQLYSKMPDDLNLFVRKRSDIPITMKEDIVKILEKKGWKERNIPDPTLLQRMVRKKEEP